MNQQYLKGLKQKLYLCKKPDRNTFKPKLFLPSIDHDVHLLEQLLESNSNIVVHDRIDEQLKELFKIRNPKQKLSENDLDGLLHEWTQNNSIDSYGVWVYYPWNETLIHLLPEEEFIELRTSRNQYKLTKEEQTKLANKKIGVIGLSVGQSVSVTMAIERIFGTIKIADFDTLELSNLNRIRRGVDSLGLQKTVVVAREIAEIDPFLNVEVLHEGVTEDNIDDFFLSGGKLDALIEECDSLDIKVLSRLKARNYGVPVIMDTSDRGMIDIERFDLDNNRPIFHGLVSEEKLVDLKNLTTEQKIPVILDMVGVEDISKRFKASMLEVEQTITTWPQLATSVTMGGAFAADVCRRVLLDQLHISGRFYIDIEELIADPNKRVDEIGDENRPEIFSFRKIKKEFNKYGTIADNECLDLDTKTIKDLVEHAATAPSGGNCQPWKWYYHNRILYLFNDENLGYSFLNFEDRGSYIALGAALENLSLRSKQLGLKANIEVTLDKIEALVARISFTQQTDIILPPYEDDLAKTIKRRLTNRKQGETNKPISSTHLDNIRHEVKNHPGYSVNIVEDFSRIEKLAEVIGGIERLRMLHSRSHEDLFNEVRWNDDEARSTADGIDIATLELNASDIAGLKLVKDSDAVKYLRDWKKGNGFIEMTGKTPKQSSALCLLSVDDHSPEAVLHGGRVLERIWLYANANGIAFQPVSPATFIFYRLRKEKNDLEGFMKEEIEKLKKKFDKILDMNEDVNNLFLFRLFYADKPNIMSYRYDLDKILLIDQ